MRFRPVTPDALVALLAERVLALPTPARVLVDGAAGTEPHALADALVEPLRALGRPVLRVRADDFLRDASVRLEHGHDDAESYYYGWVDHDALVREVLGPVGPGGDRTWLPTLREPVTNRSTRDTPRLAPADAVLVLSGELLAVADLPAELWVHLTASPAALARRTPEQDRWQLPVHARYADEHDPVGRADVVVRTEHLDRPAVSDNG